MRVRTAIVTPDKAEGVKTLFDHIVGRHLAWLIGTGHPYSDLASRAHSHGYAFWQTEDEETWMAVRDDLIAATREFPDLGVIEIEPVRSDLGLVRLGTNLDSQMQDDKALVFVLEDGKLAAYNEDNRITSNVFEHSLSNDDYNYAEYNYTIRPLAD